MTGVSFLTTATVPKMLEMLHEAAANVSVVGMLHSAYPCEDGTMARGRSSTCSLTRAVRLSAMA
jgi:hypothetical protein